MDTRTSPFRARLTQLREVLAREKVDALLVPSSDPHLSEYLPERWQGRQWLSGFTGSAGTLVVASRTAALFTDSRYWVQAEAELAGSGRLVIRPSGTEPLIRVMAEGDNRDTVESAVDDAIDVIAKAG